MSTTSDPTDPRLTRGADETPCAEPIYARGMCAKHYAREWRRGLRPLPVRTCSVADCTSPHKGYGLCQKHLGRHRKGQPLVGDLRTLHPKRYRIVTRRGHALAMKSGRVAVHRLALFEAMGDLTVPCFWCGSRLAWRAAAGSETQALFVDHLDHDRHNNAPSNLVPSCNPCNAGRMTPTTRTSVWDDGSGQKVGT